MMIYSTEDSDHPERNPFYGVKIVPLDWTKPEDRKEFWNNLLWFSPLFLIILFIALI